jgi:pyruvate/2-oxoglutarate dehydrogenase complex dihydrolipoamide acyltransferase (E2) component
MLPLSLTFDHRMLDGEPAARFISAIHDCLEHPELMLA